MGGTPSTPEEVEQCVCDNGVASTDIDCTGSPQSCSACAEGFTLANNTCTLVRDLILDAEKVANAAARAEADARAMADAEEEALAEAERAASVGVADMDIQNRRFIQSRCSEFCASSDIQDCDRKCYGDPKTPQSCEGALQSWKSIDEQNGTSFADGLSCDGRLPVLMLMGQKSDLSEKLVATQEYQFKKWVSFTVLSYAKLNNLCEKYDPEIKIKGFDQTATELGLACASEDEDGNGLCPLDPPCAIAREQDDDTVKWVAADGGPCNSNFAVLCPGAGTDGTTYVKDVLGNPIDAAFCEQLSGNWDAADSVCIVTDWKHAMQTVRVKLDGTTVREMPYVCPADYGKCKGVDIFCPRIIDRSNSLEEVDALGDVGGQDYGPWFALTNGHNEDEVSNTLTLNRPFSTETEELKVEPDSKVWGGSFAMQCWQKK